MATNTPNYNLVKQGVNEFYDIEVVNGNLDKIDTAIKQTKDIADSKASSNHTHTIADVSNLQTTLNNKANASHNHSIANVTNLQITLDGKANTSHVHTISDVSNLQTTLNGKANTSHTHTIANINNLQTTLDSKANNNDLTELEGTVTQHLAQNASTTQAGHVRLSNDTNSTSETLAPTMKALNEVKQYANDGKGLIATAINGKGGIASGSDTFATLASAIEGLGGGIKSIQRFNFNVPIGTSGNITISSVDTNSSVIRLISLSPSNLNADIGSFNLKFLDSTTIQWSRYITTGGAFISFEVIEFENVKNIQRHEVLLSDSDSNVSTTISTVALNKSLLFYTYRTNISNSAYTYFMPRIRLNTSTVFNIIRQLGGPSVCCVEIIEF